MAFCLVLLRREDFELASEAGGLFAGISGNLARLVPLGLGLRHSLGCAVGLLCGQLASLCIGLCLVGELSRDALQLRSQDSGLLFGSGAGLLTGLQCRAQAPDFFGLLGLPLGLRLDLQTGRGQLHPCRFGGLLLALDALRLVGQVGGLLLGLAGQGVGVSSFSVQ